MDGVTFDQDADVEIPVNEADLDRRQNWTIKNVPLRFRLAVRHGAAAKGETAIARLSRAHALLEAQEAGQSILPPSRAPGRALAVREADMQADTQANMGNLPGLQVPRLQRLATLARLAMDLTPEGKDSRAQRLARRVLCAELQSFTAEPVPEPEPC
jgi:hypothetical protein